MHIRTCFVDGQYLASRLSRSINQESSKLKSLLQKFNSLAGDETITWNDATDLSSRLWLLEPDGDVPKRIKLNAVKHHHLSVRADKEIQLLQCEMRATFSFFMRDWQEINTAIEGLKLQPCSSYNNGALNLLQLARLKCEGFLYDIVSSYSLFVDLPSLPTDKFFPSASAISYRIQARAIISDSGDYDDRGIIML